MNQSNPYPVVIYLDQKYVFDILAMMEKGFSQLETIKTIRSEQEDKTRKLSGDIGIKNVFSFLGVSFGGERGSSNQTGASQEQTAEKVYTPNSLFARMRDNLHKETRIVSDLSTVVAGDFVEFKTLLQKNPLIEALQTMKSIGDLALTFAEKPSIPARNKQQSSKSGKSEFEKTLDQIDALLKELLGEGNIDLIGVPTSARGIQAVITMSKDYLGDLSMSDIIDGEYFVIGKVTKVLKQRSGESINLLRRSTLGKLSVPVIESFTSALSSAEQYGIKMPDMVTEITGPAIQILPVAVFI